MAPAHLCCDERDRTFAENESVQQHLISAAHQGSPHDADADAAADDDGGIPAPRAAPHRAGLQPSRGCLKTPGQPSRRVTRSRSHRGVTFAADDRCLVTGDVYTPHPRDHVEWRAARRAAESPEKREWRRQRAEQKAERRQRRRQRNAEVLAARAANQGSSSSGEEEGAPLSLGDGGDEPARAGRTAEEEESAALGTPAHAQVLVSGGGEPEPCPPMGEEESRRRTAERAEEVRLAERGRRLRLAMRAGRERQRQRDREGLVCEELDGD